MMEIFDLTKKLYVTLTSNWLTTTELSILDSAVCNKEKRAVHLQYCAESTILGIKDFSIAARHYLEWICAKDLNVKYLHIHLHNIDSHELVNQLKFHNVLNLHIAFEATPTIIPEAQLVNALPNKFKMLSSLIVYRVAQIQYPWIMAMAEKCPLLQKVEFIRIEISDIAIKYLSECCPHLKDVTVKYCNIGVANIITVESVVELVKNCNDIQRVAYDMFEYNANSGNQNPVLKMNSTALDKQFEVLVDTFKDIKEVHLVLEKMTLKTLIKLRESLTDSLTHFEMRTCSKKLTDIETHMIAIAQACQALTSITVNCDLTAATVLSILGYLPQIGLLRSKTLVYDTVRKTMELKAAEGKSGKVTDSDVMKLVGYPFIITDITSIVLEDCPHITDRGLTRIAEVFNINLQQFAALQCGSITDTGVMALFEQCTAVTDLNISNCRLVSVAVCNRLPQHFDQLQHVNWSNYSHFFSGAISYLHSEVIEQISRRWMQLHTVKMIGPSCVSFGELAVLVAHCPELCMIETSFLNYCKDKHVHFSNCPSVIVDAEIVTFLGPCTDQTIGEFKVATCPHITDATLVSMLRTFHKTLTSFHVAGCPLVTEATLQAVVNHDCAGMRVVNAFGARDTVESIRCIPVILNRCHFLTEFQNDHIKYSQIDHALSLKGNSVGNVELMEILSCIPLLESVMVQNNDALDDTTVHWIAKRYRHRLTNLQIRQCNILTGESVRSVATQCSELRKLDFVECRLVTIDCIEIMLEHCGNLQQLQSFSLGCPVRDHAYDDVIVALIARFPALKYLLVTSSTDDGKDVIAPLLEERGVRHHPKLVVYG